MQTTHFIRTLLILLTGLVLLAPDALHAQDPNTAGSPEAPAADPNAPLSLSLNFQNASLQAVLEYLSDQAGLVIIALISIVLISRNRIARTYDIPTATLKIPTDAASIEEGQRIEGVDVARVEVEADEDRVAVDGAVVGGVAQQLGGHERVVGVRDVGQHAANLA